MYCPSCANEINVDLKYCNRCGANLTSNSLQPTVVQPVKLTLPALIIGFTVVIGLGIIFAGAGQFAVLGVHPFAIAWMVLFAGGTLFGSVAMLIRFWTKMIDLQREGLALQSQNQPRQAVAGPTNMQQLPPRLEPVPSVTENTTRTFTPIYQEPSDRGTR